MDDNLEMETLYHYTSFEAFCSIVKSDRFIMSNFSKANDYKERAKLHTDEISQYRYLSCTHYRGINAELLSYTNAPLWYFYANKNNGVCICFDKNKLLNKIDVVKDGFILYRNGVTHIDGQSAIEYLMEKRKSWEYEQEYRILANANFKEINQITGCIRAVYLGTELENSKIASLYADIPNHIEIHQLYVDPYDGRLNHHDYRKTMQNEEANQKIIQ